MLSSSFSMEAVFEFEKPIVNLEKKLQDLKDLAKQEGVDFTNEIQILEKKVETLIEEVYSKLSSWQRIQLSRHPNRPYTRDYIDALFPDFMDLSGDRAFGEDQAMLGGIATWRPAQLPNSKKKPKPVSIVILGHQKGRTTKQKMERNFGMARPEGYRKAMRLMDMADRFKMPVLTLIDTPGAYPGIEAEERGQAQAIAESIHCMFKLKVPVVSIVIGEGGSGGALAIGIANKVLMQQYSTYSVISPESCASILWSDSSLAERASEKLKMNPPDLAKLGIIDGIIPEPKGGAHRNWNEAIQYMRAAIDDNFNHLFQVWNVRPEDLVENRISKFRAMGQAALAQAPTQPNP